MTETKQLEDACVALVADIRFACGDNGKRMQPELVEFIRGLAQDAGRYRWLRENCGYSGSGPHTGAQVIVYYADAGDGRHGIAYTGPEHRVGIMAIDTAIDRAIDAMAAGEDAK